MKAAAAVRTRLARVVGDALAGEVGTALAGVVVVVEVAFAGAS